MNIKGKKKGFTLIELLVTVSVMIILILLAFQAYPIQIAKARDADRKDDLKLIKVKLEEYYNDNNCYPPEEDVQCGSIALSQYIKTIPCDPLTGESYRYDIESNPCPQWWKTFTDLENDSDEDIAEIGCTNGCGPSEEELDYNYGVSSGNTTVGEFVGEAPPPPPSPSLPPASPSPLPSDCIRGLIGDGECIAEESGGCPGSSWVCDSTGQWCCPRE